MNAERLLRHYERIADAPDVIARLRRFVLELAVRGKLVPQYPNDEPASELLKRIAKERARLVKAGDLKREKPMDRLSGNNLSFEVPAGWSAVCLSEIAVCLDYRRVPINGTEREARIEGKPQADLFPYYGATQQQGWIDDYLFDGEFVLLGEDGVPFHDPLRAKAYLITGKSWVNNHAHVFQAILTSPRFLVHCLNVFDYAGRVVGATRAKLNQAQAVTIPVPLPPLAEQYRIVAKVDELMALCDQLEAARTARETTRNRLTAASLARLNAPDPETFHDDARFALNALPALTTRPDQIKALRQTILNLAVRGKLVPQDPNDRPASELLRAIGERRKKLYAGKMTPKPRALPRFVDLELPFDVPSGWAWSTLGELCYQVSDGPHFSPKYVSPEHGVPFLSTRNVRPDGFDLTTVKYVSRADHEEFCKRVRPEPGDIIYTKGGTTGIAKVNNLDFEFSVWVHLAVLKIEKELLFPRYVETALNSPHCYEQSQRYTRGISNFDLGLTRMIKITIPLPPLAEQQRIVAKVDELMALCDRLEASLIQAANDRRRLLEALLAEALTSDQGRTDAIDALEAAE